MKYPGIVLAIVLLSGCISQAETIPDGLQLCPDSRPQFCTREYRPVCGYGTDSAGMLQAQTYGNACSACADKVIKGYIKDVCPG